MQAFVQYGRSRKDTGKASLVWQCTTSGSLAYLTPTSGSFAYLTRVAASSGLFWYVPCAALFHKALLVKTKEIHPETMLSIQLGSDVGSSSIGKETEHVGTNLIVLCQKEVLEKTLVREKEHWYRTESSQI